MPKSKRNLCFLKNTPFFTGFFKLISCFILIQLAAPFSSAYTVDHGKLFPLSGDSKTICLRLFSELNVHCSDGFLPEHQNLLRTLFYYFKDLNVNHSVSLHLNNQEGPQLVSVSRGLSNQLELYLNKDAGKNLNPVLSDSGDLSTTQITYNNELFKQLAVNIGTPDSVSKYIQKKFGIRFETVGREPLKFEELTAWLRLFLDLPAEQFKRLPFSMIQTITVMAPAKDDRSTSEKEENPEDINLKRIDSYADKIELVPGEDPVQSAYRMMDYCGLERALKREQWSDLIHNAEVDFNEAVYRGDLQITVEKKSGSAPLLLSRARQKARIPFLEKRLVNHSIFKDCSKQWVDLSKRFFTAFAKQKNQVLKRVANEGFRFLAYLPLQNRLLVLATPSLNNLDLSVLTTWMSIAAFSQKNDSSKSLNEFFKIDFTNLNPHFETAKYDHYFVKNLWKKKTSDGDSGEPGIYDHQLDLVQSLVSFLYSPEAIKSKSPEKFEFIQKEIFAGFEYYTDAATRLKIYINSQKPDTQPPVLSRPLHESLEIKVTPINTSDDFTHRLTATLSGIVDDNTGVAEATLVFTLSDSEDPIYVSKKLIKGQPNQNQSVTFDTNLFFSANCKTKACVLRLDHVNMRDRAGNTILLTPAQAVISQVNTSHITWIKPVFVDISDAFAKFKDNKAKFFAESKLIRNQSQDNIMTVKVPAPATGSTQVLRLYFDYFAFNDLTKSLGVLDFYMFSSDFSFSQDRQSLIAQLALNRNLPRGKYVLKTVDYRVHQGTKNPIAYTFSGAEAGSLSIEKPTGAELSLPKLELNGAELSSSVKVKDGLEYFKIDVRLPIKDVPAGATVTVDAEFISPTHKEFKSQLKIAKRGENVLTGSLHLPPNPERGFYILANLKLTTKYEDSTGVEAYYNRINSGTFRSNENPAINLLTRGIKVNLGAVKK